MMIMQGSGCCCHSKHGNSCCISSIIIFILSFVLLLLCNHSGGTALAAKPKPPNIVILFADNLGYDDISWFRRHSRYQLVPAGNSSSIGNSNANANATGAAGEAAQSQAETPSIDRIGNEGMTLYNWNSAAALCSASRSALLTGRYPIRTGTYPRVFRPDATYGLLPEEVTLAELLQQEQHHHHHSPHDSPHDSSISSNSYSYATSIVGKWHLGHLPPFVPTNQGFDSWFGIPYHMSGGSVDGHQCHNDNYDANNNNNNNKGGSTTANNRHQWLPLYHNASIVEQPVVLDQLATKYVSAATGFIEKNAKSSTPFFLYMAFSHVHQLCASNDSPEQETCQWASSSSPSDANASNNNNAAAAAAATFANAVEEMDWISGQILKSLDDQGVANDTIVLFTSDNGPWVAEQKCSGSKGPFRGTWFQNHESSQNCTACPHDYHPRPTRDRPHRCVLPDTALSVDGIPCGHDTGLGSLWEANLRMPALIRYPRKIPSRSQSHELVSTLDVLPTLMSMVNKPIPTNITIDGIDVSRVFYGGSSITQQQEDEGGGGNDKSNNNNNNNIKNNFSNDDEEDRILFFWRDGFQEGPLPPPYGRFDVAAVKMGRIKLWFWTKSAHYNADDEVFHDPPLLFDTISDPAESTPLNPNEHRETIEYVQRMVERHKQSVAWTLPLALPGAPENIPCVDRSTGCRTSTNATATAATSKQMLHQLLDTRQY